MEIFLHWTSEVQISEFFSAKWGTGTARASAEITTSQPTNSTNLALGWVVSFSSFSNVQLIGVGTELVINASLGLRPPCGEHLQIPQRREHTRQTTSTRFVPPGKFQSTFWKEVPHSWQRLKVMTLVPLTFSLQVSHFPSQWYKRVWRKASWSRGRKVLPVQTESGRTLSDCWKKLWPDVGSDMSSILFVLSPSEWPKSALGFSSFWQECSWKGPNAAKYVHNRSIQCCLFLTDSSKSNCVFLQDCSVDVVAVLNDTTGTLLAGSYLDKKCFIGLIMGETNALSSWNLWSG